MAMGVVIGETSEIVDDVLIYQKVRDYWAVRGTRRENAIRPSGIHVVIGTGAKVLGSITIGNNVKIGAGSVVVRPVPSDSTVVGIPGRVVRSRHAETETLEHGQLPDPEREEIDELKKRVDELEQRLHFLVDKLEIEAEAGKR